MVVPTNTNSQFLTTTTQQAPYIAEHSQQLLDSVGGTQPVYSSHNVMTSPGVTGLIDKDYQNYQDLGAAGEVDPRLAPFSQDQIAGFDLAQQGIGAYQPYLDYQMK